MLSFLIELIAGLFGYSDTLNTKKIDQNIEQLNQHDWFKNIYEDERYHRLFFVNKHVRRYLQSTIRVRKIIRSKEAQRKLLFLLDKQITPVMRPDYIDKDLVPDTLLSVSECICDFHPETAVLWSGSNEAKRKYAQQLNISHDTYEEIEKWVEDRLEEGIFGFPQVFTTIELAREFLSKFLCHLSDTRIIGIGLPEKYVEEFIEYEELQNKLEESQYGIEKLLLQRIPIDEKDSIMLGYEVLGFEYGTFHSYLCNGLEKDYEKHFGFTLNENGFISNLIEAIRYCDYTNDDEVGAEPVLWLPWGIFEYKI